VGVIAHFWPKKPFIYALSMYILIWWGHANQPK